MAQKYRIYINQKVILITTVSPKHPKSYQQLDNQFFDLKTIYAQVLNQPAIDRFYILCDDSKIFLKKLIKSVVLVEAAGGLVKNADGDYLFIYRNDKWDLPKGKLEKGESKKEGAVREVEEECGISIKRANKKIVNTYHMYPLKGDVVLKKTYWFAMKYNGSQQLTPQTEEGITDVRWFNKLYIKDVQANTFPSITDVLKKAKLIKGTAAPL